MDVPNVQRKEYQLVSTRLLSTSDSTNESQLDISDDGFLSLMSDDGVTKDDVKVPEGEVGERIDKLFKQEEKDLSMFANTYHEA